MLRYAASAEHTLLCTVLRMHAYRVRHAPRARYLHCERCGYEFLWLRVPE